MLLDPAVEHRKFDREVALLEKNAARLHAVGVSIVRVARPEIDFLLVPRLPLRVVIPGPGIPVVSGQSYQGLELPGLAARAFGVRVDLGGYDQRPPSITFRDPSTWDLAPYSALPVGQLLDHPEKAQIVLLDGHPIEKRPFLCLRGVREYHEHPQHDGDDWAMYRSALNVYVLIERLARVSLASVRPLLILATIAPGQMQILLQWAAEVGS